MPYYTRQQLPPIGARVVRCQGSFGRKAGTVVAQGNYNDWVALDGTPHSEDNEPVWYVCVRWDGFDYERELPLTSGDDLADFDREAWHSEWPDAIKVVLLPVDDDDLAVMSQETG